MTKRALIVFTILLSLPVIFSFDQPSQKKIKTIIIDPGHGGFDKGAVGATSTESQICLEISLKLGAQIESSFPGVKVLYTRTTDIMAGNKSNKNDGLRYRADFANQSGADLFISVHVNAAPKLRHRTPNGYRYVGKGSKRRKVTAYKTTYSPNPAHGTETYIWAADETSHKTQFVNTEEMYGETDSTITAPDMNDPVLKAFQLLYTKKFFENSLVFANLVENEFKNSGRVSRGVKQRNDVGIWVLHATGMPSVLVETGFISNREEEEYLNSEKGQAEIVKNITDALRNYIQHVEKTPANSNTGKNPQPDQNTKLPATKSVPVANKAKSR